MTSNADDNLIAALRDVINSMYGEYDGARGALRRALGSSMTQASGISLAELTVAVQSVLTYENRERAEQIAKTICYGAGNLANRRAWERSGVVKTVKWFTADDAEVCGFCAELDGNVVSANDCFLKKGDTLTDKRGVEMIVTRNIEAPPLHEGCRCCCRLEGISLD
jgi:hypothetical protein